MYRSTSDKVFIDQLPDEVLVHIFHLVLYDHNNPMLQVYSLMRASHLWQRLVFNTPDFWTSLYAGVRLEDVSRYAHLSRNRPLSIVFDEINGLPSKFVEPQIGSSEKAGNSESKLSYEMEDLVEALGRHAERVLSLEIRLFPVDILRRRNQLFKIDGLPGLRELNASSPSGIPVRLPGRPAFFLTEEVMKRLYTLSLNNLPVKWENHVAPHLRHLRLESLALPPSMVVQLLRSSSQLKTLTLRNLKDTYSSRGIPKVPFEIPLLRLTSLELVNLDSSFYRVLTSRLDVPALEESIITPIHVNLFRARRSDLFKPSKLQATNKVEIQISQYDVRAVSAKVFRRDGTPDPEFPEGIDLKISFTVDRTASDITSLVIELLEWLEVSNRALPVALAIKQKFPEDPQCVLSTQILEIPTLVRLKVSTSADASFVFAHFSSDDKSRLERSRIDEFDFRGAHVNEEEFLRWLQSLPSEINRLGLPGNIKIDWLPEAYGQVAQEIHHRECCERTYNDSLRSYRGWWCDHPLYDNRTPPVNQS